MSNPVPTPAIVPFLSDTINYHLDTTCKVTLNKPKTKATLTINPYVKVVVRKVEGGVKVFVYDSIIKADKFFDITPLTIDTIHNDLEYFITKSFADNGIN